MAWHRHVPLQMRSQTCTMLMVTSVSSFTKGHGSVKPRLSANPTRCTHLMLASTSHANLTHASGSADQANSNVMIMDQANTPAQCVHAAPSLEKEPSSPSPVIIRVQRTWCNTHVRNEEVSQCCTAVMCRSCSSECNRCW